MRNWILLPTYSAHSPIGNRGVTSIRVEVTTVDGVAASRSDSCPSVRTRPTMLGKRQGAVKALQRRVLGAVRRRLAHEMSGEGVSRCAGSTITWMRCANHTHSMSGSAQQPTRAPRLELD